MQPKFELYKLYKEPPVSLIQRHFTQFVLPTEVVLTEMKISIPLFARAYEVDLHNPFDTDEVMPYERLRARQGVKEWNGSASVASPIRVLEYFSNWGDDGHTDFELVGWVLVPAPELTVDLYTQYNHPLMRKIQKATLDI
jgi:hypothetical protein